MLTENLHRPCEKQIALFVRSEPFREVLGGLLREWSYTLLEAPSPSALLLAEEGYPLPEESGAVLWLTRSRYQERNRLPLPLSVEELWGILETRFHKPPRRHIRTTLHVPVTVKAGDGVTESCFSSLSDVGGRLEFHRETVVGEKFRLLMAVAGKDLELQARVIYVIPGGEPGGRERTRIGVIFERLPPEDGDWLRAFIVRSYLERVRARMNADTFREGLSHFDIPLALLADLGYGFAAES